MVEEEKCRICYLYSKLLGVKHFIDESVVDTFLRTEVPHSARVLLNHGEVFAASLLDGKRDLLEQ